MAEAMSDELVSLEGNSLGELSSGEVHSAVTDATLTNLAAHYSSFLTPSQPALVVLWGPSWIRNEWPESLPKVEQGGLLPSAPSFPRHML